MEPMHLGSPTGSPLANTSPYLPAFLMGERIEDPKTPRNNTLSPNKGRALSMGTLGTNTPNDYNRPCLEQRTLFGSQSTPLQTPGGIKSFSAAQTQIHNISTAGPPMQGLFDSLHEELNQLPTPNGPLYYGTPIQSQSKAINDYDQFSLLNGSNCNDSYFNQSSRNVSRNIVSPLGSQKLRSVEFWVTVFGFPPTARAAILNHFAECGTIIEHVFPPHDGNWVHLKFSSRIECDKAINYNGKVLGSNIMIGVSNCNDKQIIDRGNFCNNNLRIQNVRSLTQTGYNNAQAESSVVLNSSSLNAPQKSTGIVNKAMELFFGW